MVKYLVGARIGHQCEEMDLILHQSSCVKMAVTTTTRVAAFIRNILK